MNELEITIAASPTEHSASLIETIFLFPVLSHRIPPRNVVRKPIDNALARAPISIGLSLNAFARTAMEEPNTV